MSTTGETTIKFIEMLLNESAALLVRHGETHADANKLARGFVLSYFHKVSGLRHLYFRKDLKFDALIKRDTIRADFKAGLTVFELADKYKLTNIRIYQVLKQKEAELTETDTSQKAPLMIEAVRMLLKAEIDKEDAISAARGLVAIILARFAGIIISISNPGQIETVIRNIEIVRHYRAGKSTGSLAAHFKLPAEEIRDIVKTYPAAKIPEVSDLPKIKTRLFNMASSFSGHDEIKALLESATDQISRAERIITQLKGGRTKCRH